MLMVTHHDDVWIVVCVFVFLSASPEWPQLLSLGFHYKPWGGQGDPLEKWRFCTQGKKVSVLFVNSEQLLLLFSPGAGRHPGFIVEGLHWCYSRLWWWFDTSTQSPQMATPSAQQKWKANGCRKNTKPIVFITSSGHKNCEWGKVLQEWHHINQ